MQKYFSTYGQTFCSDCSSDLKSFTVFIQINNCLMGFWQKEVERDLLMRLSRTVPEVLRYSLCVCTDTMASDSLYTDNYTIMSQYHAQLLCTLCH